LVWPILHSLVNNGNWSLSSLRGEGGCVCVYVCGREIKCRVLYVDVLWILYYDYLSKVNVKAFILSICLCVCVSYNKVSLYYLTFSI
jgi:hypothetical protein